MKTFITQFYSVSFCLHIDPNISLSTPFSNAFSLCRFVHAVEVSEFLRCGATLLCNCFPTFRRDVLVPSSWTFHPLKMKLLRRLETSRIKYPVTCHHISEGYRPQNCSFVRFDSHILHTTRTQFLSAWTHHK